MGFLSKIFGKKPIFPDSYVRNWTERRLRDLRYDQELNDESLFVSMMYALTSFVMALPKSAGDIIEEMHRNFPRKYWGDASLFELGCYLYFRTDLWLFQNRPHDRDRLAASLSSQFLELFSNALPGVDVSYLFDERVGKYASMVRNGEKLDRYHFHLEQLIKLTADGCPPQQYDFDSAPLVIDGFSSEMFLKFELSSFEREMIPAFMKTMENYFNYLEG